MTKTATAETSRPFGRFLGLTLGLAAASVALTPAPASAHNGGGFGAFLGGVLVGGALANAGRQQDYAPPAYYGQQQVCFQDQQVVQNQPIVQEEPVINSWGRVIGEQPQITGYQQVVTVQRVQVPCY
jgi:hypothetical protein